MLKIIMDIVFYIIIFIEKNGESSLWLDQVTINQIENLDELKTTILKRIKNSE